MIIVINEQQKNLQVSSVSSLLTALEQPEKGISIAVNQHIIARRDWDTFQLSEHDQVALFQAIAGG
jgi:sulfur carrier protein